MHDPVKLLFRLQPDEDGYPPYQWESVWANPVSDGLYQIDNIPFFVSDISLGDIVEAEYSDDVLVYVKTAVPSSNGTIHVVCYDHKTCQQLLSRLPGWGCDYEVGELERLVAIDVPARAEVDDLLAWLDRQARAEQLVYEESAPRYLS